MLLNATLTVRENQAGSHQNKGWETFTDAVISRLSEQKKDLVFVLWGNYAIAKRILIDITRHHILTAAHPSPFSVHKGFFGCRHFSKINEILVKSGIDPVDWNLQ
jgi:uracil-DNA glycosylase